MKKILSRTLLMGLTLSLMTPAFAAVDRFNTYQWQGEKKDWYEWWYYKVVVPGTNQSFYFVYGIVNPWDEQSLRASSGAYVSMGSFGDREIWEQKFPLSEFFASKHATEVRVGPHRATANRIQGRLFNESGEEVQWDLTLKKEWAFDAMGWGTGVRGISNIYWYPAQASARMNGVIRYKGQEIRLENAPAYQDRNWGRSLPKWWVWVVSNHFESSPGTTLAVGGGRPKVFEKFSIKDGLTVGLHHRGREYKFRTPDGDSIRTDIRFGHWEIEAVNKRNQKIRISAYAPPEKFMKLVFISPTGETFNDYEALKGDLTVELFERKNFASNWKSVEVLTSREAGIEYGSFEEFDIGTLFSREIRLE